MEFAADARPQPVGGMKLKAKRVRMAADSGNSRILVPKTDSLLEERMNPMQAEDMAKQDRDTC